MGELVELPDWISKLKPLTRVVGTLEEIGRDPTGWLRSKLVRFVLGALAGFVLDIAGIIRDAWNAINGALSDAGSTAASAVGMVGENVVEPLGIVNQMLFDLALGDTLGPFEAPIIIGLYLVEFAIVLRLARPALLGLGEVASAIPVIGGVINSGVTFGVRASDALWGYARSVVGGGT